MRADCFRLILALCLAPALMWGQSTFASIVGNVRDASGAVVKGASIRAVDEDRGVAFETTTNEAGGYEFYNLQAGRYTVSANAPGFKESRIAGLVLDARKTARADVELQVGQVSEQINVEAGLPLINTETQTIQSAFTKDMVLSLPANYRGAGSTSPYSLIASLPGVQSDNGGGYSIQGGLPSQAEISVDGISTIDVRGNSPLRNMFPSVEAIAEIRVQGVGNNAEYGQVGDITTVSKSGSNAFHGSAFWYHQNRALDALAFGQVSKPQKTANTYGGSVGGRIIRDRTFFFGTFERLDFRSGTTVQNTVPTRAMRSGDFSAEAGTLRDPFNNNQPFAGNRIDPSRIAPQAQRLLELFPLPNFGDGVRQTAANFRENRSAPIESNQFDVRIDQVLSSRQSIFGRYTFKNIDQISPNILALPADSRIDNNRSLVVSHNFLVKPSLVNEFRFGYTYNERGNEFPFDGIALQNDLGLRGLGPNYPYNGLVSISFSPGLTTAFSKGRPGTVKSQNFQFTNNLTWVKGRHTFKFGADVRRVRTTDVLSFTSGNDFGDFSFDGSFSGNSFADFLLGVPFRSGFAQVGPDLDGRSIHQHYYAQDSWRVSPRLTLELGVRYEYHPPFTDVGDNIGNFDRYGNFVVIPSSATARNLLAPGFLQSVNACPGPSINGVPCTQIKTAEEADLPEGLRTRDLNNFNPRFGFAYRPFADAKTVVRGGFGMYTMTQLGSVFYSLTGTTSSDVRAFNNTRDAQGRPQIVWPNTQVPGSSGVLAGSLGSFEFRTANDSRQRDPYAMQWSLSVDRDLGWNTGLRVSYIGMRSVKLPFSPDINQPQPSRTPFNQRPLTDRPFPNFSLIYSRDNHANAIYNAMQVEVNHRFSGGLSFTSAYTWAKNLADNAGPAPSGFAGENGGGRVTDSLNRRGDRGDVYATRRHRWISTGVFELPFGKGRKFGGDAGFLANALIGGWQLSSIFLWQSGAFLTPVMSGGDPSGTNGNARGTQRPDRVGTGSVAEPTAARWLDRSAFVCPGRVPGASDQYNCSVTPIGRFGNSGVGILTGPGTVNLNLGVAKRFRLTERWRLTLEGSFTNAANHINLADPGLNIANSAFGLITSARTAESGGSRVGQLAARIDF
jgi:hypothetical protein